MAVLCYNKLPDIFAVLVYKKEITNYYDISNIIVRGKKPFNMYVKCDR